MEQREFKLAESGVPIGESDSRLYFKVTRTHVVALYLDGRKVGGDTDTSTFPVIDAHWGTVTTADSVLRVDYFGGEPELTDPADLVRLVDKSTERFRAPDEMSAAEAAQAYVRTVVDEKRAYVAQQEDPPRAALWFFFELDLASNPDILRNILIKSTKDIWVLELVKDVARRLSERTEARRNHTAIPEIDRRKLAFLSALQLPIYEACLQVSTGTELLESAFEGFAAGDFYCGDFPFWNIAPNDRRNYVLFAEFSLCCIRSGVDGDFWNAILPVQVWSQSIFHQAYAGRRGGRPGPSPAQDYRRSVRLRGRSVDELEIIHTQNCTIIIP